MYLMLTRGDFKSVSLDAYLKNEVENYLVTRKKNSVSYNRTAYGILRDW